MPKFSKAEQEEFGKEFLDKYLSLGFGVLSKKETELLIFSLIEKTSELKQKTNYEIANQLRITENKVKNIRLESAMRFSTPNHKANLGNIVQRLLDKNMLPKLDAGRIEISLENPIEKREFEYAVKLAGHHVEYGRNREIVVTSPVMLLEVIVSNAEKGNEHFKEFVQDNIKDKKDQAAILNSSLTLPQKISLLGQKLVSPSAAKLIFTSAKKWASGA